MVRLAKSPPRYIPRPQAIEQSPVFSPFEEKELELLASIDGKVTPEPEGEGPEEVLVKNLPDVQKVEVMNFPAEKEEKEIVVNIPDSVTIKNPQKEVTITNLPKVQSVVVENFPKEKDDKKVLEALDSIYEVVKKLKFSGDSLKTTGSGNSSGTNNNTALLGGRGVMPVGASTEAKQDDQLTSLASILAALQNVLTVRPEYLITKTDEIGGGITYVGKAEPGTASAASTWQIFRIDESSTPDMEVLFAEGSAAFDKTWNDRASYTYS